MAERMLFAEEVAEVLGVLPRSITMYHYEASRARREGTANSGTFPEPAERVRREIPREGRHPVAAMSNRWSATDIARWVMDRPDAPGWPAERREEVANRLRSMAA